MRYPVAFRNLRDDIGAKPVIEISEVGDRKIDEVDCDGVVPELELGEQQEDAEFR